MQFDAVMVFTGETLEQIIAAGGTGNWKARQESLERRPYVIAVHNRRAEWGDAKGDHGAAFLIGRISGVQKTDDNGWRKLIQFDKYALIDVPGAWRTGRRNPIAYVKLKDIPIDPDALDWKDVKRQEDSALKVGDSVVRTPGAIIDEARRRIARAFSVDPSAVRISVNV